MMISIFLQLNKFKDWVKDMFLQVVSIFSLVVTYLLGIGLTRLVSILVGKKFLPPANANSQWQITKYSDKVNNRLY